MSQQDWRLRPPKPLFPGAVLSTFRWLTSLPGGQGWLCIVHFLLKHSHFFSQHHREVKTHYKCTCHVQLRRTHTNISAPDHSVFGAKPTFMSPAGQCFLFPLQVFSSRRSVGSARGFPPHQTWPSSRSAFCSQPLWQHTTVLHRGCFLYEHSCWQVRHHGGFHRLEMKYANTDVASSHLWSTCLPE